VTARNTASLGYFALIGDTKVTVFLTYADEESCTVDHIWTLNFVDFIGQGFGLSIKHLDFSNDCENFVAYTNTGHIAQWDVKRQKFDHKIFTVRSQDRPVTAIRSVKNSHTIITYSKQQNLFMIINARAMQDIHNHDGLPEDCIIRINPSGDGFQHVVNFQVDNSEQFLICAFAKNKVGVYLLRTGELVMHHEDRALFCEDSYIDETCCYMATLDENRRYANIHTFEWLYKVDVPTVPKQRNKE
jgi:hypothetical protein